MPRYAKMAYVSFPLLTVVQIEHTPGESGRRLIERMYPLVAEGLANGLFMPNRAGTLCGYCLYARAEFLEDP